MADRLIAEPTNESNPDIIEDLRFSQVNDSVFDVDLISHCNETFARLPRRFKDARAIKEHDTKIAKGSSTHDNSLLTLDGFAFAFLITGMCVELIEIILSIIGVYKPDSLISFLAIPASCLAIAAALGLLNLVRNSPDNQSNVSMIHARNYDLRHICADGAYELIYAHRDVIDLSKSVFEYDHSHLCGINFANLSDAYDSYTDMLVFVLANKDQLSDELRKDYARSLLKRALKLKQELEDIDDVISEQAQYMNEALRESQRTKQEVIDNNALSIMPIDED